MSFYKDNDNPVELAGLADADGDPVNDATVTAWLYRGDTELWTAQLSATGGGGYWHEGPADDLAVTVGEILRWKIQAVKDTFKLTKEWEERVRVKRP